MVIMPIPLAPNPNSFLRYTLALMRKWANEWGITALYAGMAGLFGTVALAATTKSFWWAPCAVFTGVMFVLAALGALDTRTPKLRTRTGTGTPSSNVWELTG